MVALSTTALRDAISSFEEAIELAKKHKLLGDENYYRQFRTSAIHSFEYCYELSSNLIRRYVEKVVVDTDDVRHLNFRDYMRVAAEYGLIDYLEDWVEFREWRNNTSHAYDPDIAEELFVELPKILESIKRVYTELEKRGKDVS